MYILSKIKIFIQDTKAFVAIEFGAMLPVLLLLLFGTIEISNAYYAKQHFESLIRMSEDLLLREPTLENVQNTATDMGEFLRDSVNEFAGIDPNNNQRQIGFVYTFIDRGAKIADVTDPAEQRRLFIPFQVEFGNADSITPTIQFVEVPAPAPIDRAFFLKNIIPETNPIHTAVVNLEDPIIRANINTASTTQYAIIQGRMQYRPIFRATQFTVNMDTMIFEFETAPNSVHSIYDRLPDGRVF